MTEAEWLASNDPRAMFEALKRSFSSDWPYGERTVRKRSLFGAACCRLVWRSVSADPRCRRKVEYIETMTEQRLSPDEEEELFFDVKIAAEHPKDGTPPAQMQAANLVYDAESPEMALGYLLTWRGRADRAQQLSDLLREIVGNPFRKAKFHKKWRTDTVLAVAQQAYDTRKYAALPILADALQDAGCNNDDLLHHLRDPSATHVRGCWALDLVLGKE